MRWIANAAHLDGAHFATDNVGTSLEGLRETVYLSARTVKRRALLEWNRVEEFLDTRVNGLLAARGSDDFSLDSLQ